ncbi:MAG: hypothetical protein ACXWK2_09530, partial [Rhizomicrobium sp.]
EQLLAQNIVKRPGTQSERAPAEMIQRRYMQTGYQDIYAFLLRLSDSLALSREQMQQIEARRTTLCARADSLCSIEPPQLRVLETSRSCACHVPLHGASPPGQRV